MARWIGERAAERRIPIEPAAADLLARRVGAFVREGDVDRRRQGQLAVAELEKLALYRLDAPIRREDVEALVVDAIPGSTWALLDAVGSRRIREAADLVERVLAATPEPVVLSVLHRRVRELISVLDAQIRGESVQDAARAMKLKEYPARKLWEQARAWRPDELDAALDGLLELDATLKGEAASDCPSPAPRIPGLDRGAGRPLSWPASGGGRPRVRRQSALDQACSWRTRSLSIAKMQRPSARSSMSIRPGSR